MRPILFRWRGHAIHSYKAMLFAGLVLGITTGQVTAERAGLDARSVYFATIVLLVPALAGARLLFVATEWRIYCREPERIWRRSEGGFSMLGGLPPAMAISVPLLGALDIPFGAFWDVSTFTILVGMATARVGCLLNGCCAGRSARRFGLFLPDHHGRWERRVPIQLLEGLAAVALLTVVTLEWNARPFAGAILLMAAAGYGTIRCALEPLRDESRMGTSSLVSLAMSATLAVAGAGGWFALLQ